MFASHILLRPEITVWRQKTCSERDPSRYEKSGRPCCRHAGTHRCRLDISFSFESPLYLMPLQCEIDRHRKENDSEQHQNKAIH